MFSYYKNLNSVEAGCVHLQPLQTTLSFRCSYKGSSFSVRPQALINEVLIKKLVVYAHNIAVD